MNETIQWLTAAECARRTGLTIRALRVYENYGLITPARSAAGWRRYGASELLRLNEIGLLKTLGLTLKQIRALTHEPSPSSLRQLLEMQLSAWNLRRLEVEHGLAVADAALQELRAGRSLSVEQLCSLIRSSEMTSTHSPTSTEAEQASRSAATLDRYVGYYVRNRALGVSTITCKDSTLYLEPIGQPVLELEQTDEAEFVLSKFDLVLCFEQIEEDGAKTLVVWQRGTSIRLGRVGRETALLIKEGIARRIRDAIPMAGSERALREILQSARTGSLHLDQMSPEFAQAIRSQGPHWQIVQQYFGAIVSIKFLRVSNQGWDLYEVQHENDIDRYRIALGDDGKVYGFSEASATAEKQALV